MTLILSIETSTSVCSVALHQDGNLIAYESLFIARSHAESLLAMINHLLDITHHSPRALQAIALSEGPGSYTGLRIGTTTATGLCYALEIPLIAINTLVSMVFAIKPLNITRPLCCPMIDARRMEVYCLIADTVGNILQEAHAHIVTEDSFEIWLRGNKLLFFGDGAQKCKSILSKHPNAVFIDGVYPSAKEIGVLAYDHFQQQRFINIAQFSPLYLKPFQSNINPVVD